MSDWWYVIAIAGLAAVGFAYLRTRRDGNRRSGNDRQASVPDHSDYRQDREDARLAHMSEEDRTWQAASLQRHQENQERPDNLAERRA